MRKSRKQKKSNASDSNLVLIVVMAIIGFLIYNSGGGMIPKPPPSPNQPLDEYASNLVQSISTNSTEIRKVAENYKNVADEIDTLTNPLSKSTIKRPQDAINKVDELNKASLASNLSNWKTFFDGVAGYLEAKDTEEERTVYAVGQKFNLIATGLGYQSFSSEELYSAPLASSPAPADDMSALSEEEIEKKYEKGEITGVLLDEEGQPEWIRKLAREGEKQFDAVADQEELPKNFMGVGAGKRAVYWNYALRFDNDPLPVFAIKQITGNCVEASLGDVGMTHLLGVSIFLLKKPYKWEGPGSSAFYAFRGHCGQGMSLGVAATAHSNYGYALRKSYLDGKYDLRDTLADQKFGMNNCRNPESAAADFWTECKKTPIGKVSRYTQDVNLTMDILYAGGIIHTGSTATAARNGDPICGPSGVGPHAQTCIGYDDSQEFKDYYKAHTGKTLTEPVFMFDQTWGDTQYIQKNFPYELWGKPTRGMFVLKWSDAKRLMNGSGCYAYLPDLKGVTLDKLNWRLSR